MKRTGVWLFKGTLPVVVLILALLLPPSVQAAGRTYVVKPGDTLTGIAARTGTTVWAIMRANGLRNPNYIWVGQVLIIPGPDWPPPYQCGTYYTVRWRDTLSQISRLFGVPVWAIVSANGLRNPNHIWAGQRLYIPCADYPPPPCYCTYVVRRGDTLYRIALRFGTRVQTLVQINHLYNPNYIYAGQRLQVPCLDP